MLKQENFNHRLFKILGILIALLSSFYLYNTGYHVLFYDEIRDKVAFAYPIPRSFVVATFVIWIIICLGGVGISTISRKKLEIFNYSHLKVLGILIALLSSYYMYKSGYHVLFYDETGGKDVFVIHITRSFSEVVIEFVFWIILCIGGIGIITDRKKGLLLGLIAVGVAMFPSFFNLMIAISKVSTYSSKLTVNNTERGMTILEKWDYIYSDFFFAVGLTIVVLILFLLVLKRRKSIVVTNQNTIPPQNL